MIILFLLLVSMPIYLMIAGLVIGGSYLINLLPILLAIYFITAALALAFSPLKPWFNKHRIKINTIGKLIALILFGPLLAVLTVSVISLPFVMIYAIADNPFIWYAVILFFIGLFYIQHKKKNQA